MSLWPFITSVSYDDGITRERVLVWATEDREAARKAVAHREEFSDDEQPKRPVQIEVFALRQLSHGEERCVSLPGKGGSDETEVNILLDLFVDDPVVVTIDR